MTWKEYLDRARFHYTSSTICISRSVRLLMHEKGFSQSSIGLFDCNLTSGGTENVITFNGQGGMADLDIKVASAMTKEQIINRLLKSGHLSSETVELLTRESKS